MKPRLYMIIPCYNEEKVLPITSEMFLEELNLLIAKDKISENSRILFVNDGSKDKTWDLIKELSEKDEHFIGICQSRNRGHQNAVLAGMMEAKDVADITISIDCDGQDDIAAMEAMVDRYKEMFKKKKEVHSMCDVAERLEKMGIAKGIELGREEEKKASRVEFILRVLEMKGGVDEKTRKRIEEEPDVDLLDIWFTKALKANTVQEFEQALD